LGEEQVVAVITGLEEDARPEARAVEAARPAEPVGVLRWATFVALSVVAVAHSAYTMGALRYWSLTSDQGAQYYLSRLTAHGAVPLVDFQHGWNAGSWWFGGVLYRLSGGNPTVWTYFNNRLFGCTLAAILLAAIGLRLRLHPAAMAAIVLAALFVVRPLSVKYMFPIAWVFLLLPTPWLDRGWRGLVMRAMVPAAMFWFHVELAVLLSAATVLYELLGARDEAWRERLFRAGAVGAGLAAGFLSEAAYFGLRYGMPVAELNRQVVFGQAEEFPNQFGWPFLSTPPLSNQYTVVALFPSLLLIPFVPYVWRRLSNPTRFTAFAAVCLATIAIRRPGPGHGGTVGAMIALAVVLAVCDLQSEPIPFSRRISPQAVLGGLAGAGATAALVKVGFDLDSFAGPAILVCGCAAVAAIVARFRTSLASLSVGSLVVLAVLPVATSIDRVGRMADADESFVMADTMAKAIGDEVDRCLISDEALVIPTVLPLYDRLGLRNPTPYYLFHYDFGRNKDDVLADFRSGRVPAVITSMNLPSNLPWLKDALVDNYQRCSHIGIEGPGHSVEVWVHRTRVVEDRTIIVEADIDVS
jgi:hypothetical protein